MAERESRSYRRLKCLKGRMAEQESREIANEDVPAPKKGGFINILLILVNESFQKVVSYGLLYNMIVYLTKEYHMPTAEAINAVFYWNAATDCMSLLCGFISDSYMGRFAFIGMGSVSSLLGIFLLWLTTINPKSKPPHCTPSAESCSTPTTAQSNYLFLTFSLISIGTGCVGSSAAFGIDQLERADKSEHKKRVQRFLMYYYASSSFLVMITMTATAHILDEFQWEKGFRHPLILVVLFVIMFFIRSPRFSKEKPKRNVLASCIQVIVAAWRNKNLSFPSQNSSGTYLPKKNSKIVVPSNNLRFLNKACVIRHPQQELAPDGSAINPWKLCTIEQVEELKALVRVSLVWSTGIILWVTVSKPTFMFLQTGSMNRYISEKIEIPRALFATFSVIVMVVWVLLYDHAFLPLASKVKGEPIRIGVKLRMGIGLFLSCIAMVIAAVVERTRRDKAIQEGKAMEMSALWLLPQHCLIGLAQAFTVIGQLEFFYTELPRSMAGVAVTLLGPGTAVATWLSNVVSEVVLDLSSKEGEELSWNNINQAPLDNYYTALAVMSFINLLYFCFCSWVYGPCSEQCDNNEAQLVDT